MKTSLVLLILLLFNTAAIFIEPIVQFIQALNSWYFIASEFVLILGYSVNKFHKDLNKNYGVDLNDLGFYPKQNK